MTRPNKRTKIHSGNNNNNTRRERSTSKVDGEQQQHQLAEKAIATTLQFLSANSLLQAYDVAKLACLSQNCRKAAYDALFAVEDFAYHAAGRGLTDFLSRLIIAGADINKVHMGWTPTHHAADKGKTDALRVLCAAGADVNKANTGWTPCHHACHKRHVNCLRVLVQYGADVNKANNEGFTPAHWAAEGLPRQVFGSVPL